LFVFRLIFDIRGYIGANQIGTEGPRHSGKSRALMAMLGIGF
jgi:hypothetical protein